MNVARTRFMLMVPIWGRRHTIWHLKEKTATSSLLMSFFLSGFLHIGLQTSPYVGVRLFLTIRLVQNQ